MSEGQVGSHHAKAHLETHQHFRHVVGVVGAWDTKKVAVTGFLLVSH